MDILIGILTAVEVIVCLLLILVVLMQRPRQEGLGASFGDAAASQVWGAQTTNVLQKFTVWLAIVLFALTLLLAVLVSRHQSGAKSSTIFGKAPAAAPAAKEEAKPAEAPKATEAPKAAEPAKEAPKAAEPAKETPKAAEAPKAVEPAKEAPKAEEAPKPAAPAAAAPAPAPAAPAPAAAEQPK